MGITQKEVAAELNINPWTIMNWEKNHTQPQIVSIPPIMRFLGYNPFPLPITLSQYLIAKRREKGWSIKKAAKAIGVDPGTWRNWERGQTILYYKQQVIVANFLKLSVEKLML